MAVNLVRLSRPRPSRRYRTLPGIVLCLLGLFWLGGTATTGALHVVTMSCRGRVVSATSPKPFRPAGGTLSKPADGRLFGVDFAVDVTGYALSPCLPAGLAGGPSFAAPPGDVLAGVTFQWGNADGYGHFEVAPAFSLLIGGRQLPLPGASRVSGDESYLVSVPAGDSVAFVVASIGPPQELSLESGRRVGPSPKALYRSWSSPYVLDKVDKSVRLQALDAADHFSTPERIGLTSAVLSWFPPTLKGHAGMSSAYLEVDMTAAQPGAAIDWERAMPADGRHLRLVLPGGTVVAPAEGSFGLRGTLDRGLYFFRVPWDLTRATLEVAPGTLPVVVEAATPGSTELAVVGTARFAIRLKTAAPYPGKAHGPSAAVPRYAVAPRSDRSKDSPAVEIAVVTVTTAVAVLVPVLLVVPVLVRRRQRRRGPYVFDAASGQTTPSRHQSAEPAPVEVVDATTAPGDAARPSELLPAPAPRPLVFSVLGPLEADGLVLPTKRPIVVELLCFLACQHPRRFTAGEIIAALWPVADDAPDAVSLTSFRTYVSAARRVAGEAAFPRAEGGTYCIGDGVTTDWHQFSSLVERAGAAEGPARYELLGEALGLVRGLAFSGVPEGRYGWAFADGVASRIEAEISSAAAALADCALELGRAGEVLEHLRRALAATRSREVADDLLTASGATGDVACLERTWRDLVALLGTDALSLQRSFEAMRATLAAPVAD
jgi:DNA-binding SARP family transcriptional activator